MFVVSFGLKRSVGIGVEIKLVEAFEFRQILRRGKSCRVIMNKVRHWLAWTCALDSKSRSVVWTLHATDSDSV